MSLFQKRYRLNGEFVTKLPVLQKKKKNFTKRTKQSRNIQLWLMAIKYSYKKKIFWKLTLLKIFILIFILFLWEGDLEYFLK